MALTIYYVDAFTDTPYRGNPAAVCILPEPRDERWMQEIAQETNLSETAFLHEGDSAFALRWFTPTLEVDLCGHATLASAHVLWEVGVLRQDKQARFLTKSGLLTADKKGLWIEMDFPSDPPSECNPPPELIEALHVNPRYTGKGRFDYLVEVESEEEVRQLQPDFSLLKRVPMRGVIVTSRASTEASDFVSRFFAPASGIEEDPVTGSAHCCLGPYWKMKMNRDEFLAYQASRRGGQVAVAVKGDRIRLGGQAVTVLKGELLGER